MIVTLFHDWSRFNTCIHYLQFIIYMLYNKDNHNKLIASITINITLFHIHIRSDVVFHKVRSYDHFSSWYILIIFLIVLLKIFCHLRMILPTVFLSDSNPSRLFNRANISMDAIFNWFCANKLSLNATKTQYMAGRQPWCGYVLSPISTSISI